MQLTSLRQEAARLQRQEESANAVLTASNAAMKEGKTLTPQERRSIETSLPTMVPDRDVKQTAFKQVCMPIKSVGKIWISTVEE